MIRALAIDDEPLALRQIKTYIERIEFLTLAATFNSAVEAQRWLQDNEVDLIFVDINMPDLSGIDFVRSLTSPPMVIFTTAYSEYAVEGFKLDAIDYLLKPFGFDELLRSAGKAQSLFELHNPERADEYASRYGIDRERIIISSDAHYLTDIRDKECFFTLNDEPYSSSLVRRELFRLLKGDSL